MTLLIHIIKINYCPGGATKFHEGLSLPPDDNFKSHKGQSSFFNLNSLNLFKTPSAHRALCTECQKMLGILISMIKSEKTKKEINNFWKNICSTPSSSAVLQKEVKKNICEYKYIY